MNASNILHFDLWILIIELIGSLMIVRYVILALLLLLRGSRNIEHAQYIVAEGALMGLNFKVAGTLLKTIQLQTWNQIFVFTTILMLRTLLKRLFTWEMKQIQMKQLFTKGWQED